MKDYVIINGVSSKTKTGLAINILPPITKPEMRTLVEEIDGRDGDIITKLGYSAYDKTIEIGLFGNGYDVDDIIAFFNQEGTITFSNEPDKYYNFKTIDNFDIERLLQFKTSTITFHCQPFKYLIDEEPKEIEYQYVTGEGTDITLNNTKNALMQLELNPSELTQETTPTPDNPSEVQVIKGNNSIKIENRNLWNEEWELGGYNTTTGAKDLSQDKIRNKNPINCYPTTQYYVCINNSETSNALRFLYYDKNGNYLSTQANIRNAIITTPANCYYINFMLNTSYGTTYKNDVCINYSDASFNGQYIVHQEQVLPLNLPNGMEYCKIGDYEDEFIKTSGKNLFDKDSITITNAYIDASTGVISPSQNNKCTETYISVEPNTTYTLSCNVLQRVVLYNSSKAFISSTNTSSPYTFTTTNETYYIRLSSLTSFDTSSVQLEKGSSATEYEPYGNGDWYLNKYIGKVVLDGTESNWSKSGNTTFDRFILGNNIHGIVSAGGYSNYFKVVNINIASNLYELSNNGNSQLVMNYSTYGNTTLEQFKTWLGSHNVIIYYVLETPTHTEITDTTLINQLNAIEQAVSYDEQTNISQVNTGLPFRIKASAMISGSDSVEITNNGNVYAKPILDIKGTGIINVYLNGTQMFSVDITDEIIVDIPNLETYNPNPSALMNRNVTGNISNFILPVGTNTITVDGAVEKVTITMYQRWL